MYKAPWYDLVSREEQLLSVDSRVEQGYVSGDLIGWFFHVYKPEIMNIVQTTAERYANRTNLDGIVIFQEFSTDEVRTSLKPVSVSVR